MIDRLSWGLAAVGVASIGTVLLTTSVTASAATLLPPPAYARCAACHTTGAGGSHRLGPNLFGILGTKAGTKPGFAYSPALKRSSMTWTKASLADYVDRPAAVVPGTRMMDPGVSKPADREAIIAFIASLK